MQLIVWATSAKQDVTVILRKYNKRIEIVHVKEFSATNPKAAVGEVSVKWAGLFDILEEETLVKWHVVEQEAFEISPMESAKTYIDNIRTLGR